MVRPPRADATSKNRTIRFSDQEWAAVKLVAKLRGVTVAEFVRDAVNREAERLPTTPGEPNTTHLPFSDGGP